MPVAKKQLTKLKIRQQVLYILIFSFVTVVVWVGVSLFSSQKKTGIAPDLLLLSKSLNPTINTEFVSEIERKRSFGEEELFNFPVYVFTRSADGRSQVRVSIDANQTLEQVKADLETRPTSQSPSQPQIN